MANKFILKKSSVSGKIPQPTDLDFGELALNYSDGKLYYKKADTTIGAIEGGGAPPSNLWLLKNSNYTATNGDYIIADTSNGSFTITLPPTPEVGESITIADGADFSAISLTVARNGSTIEGLSEDFSIDVKGVSLNLVYDGSTWEAFASMGVGTSTGGASYEVGVVVSAASAPTTGTWLETGKYYSKAAYPELAAKIGALADFGDVADIPSARIPVPFSRIYYNYSSGIRDATATNGIVTIAVAEYGAIRKTVDGINWTGVASTINDTCYFVKYINGKFIAGFTAGKVAYSNDGTNWLNVTTFSNGNSINNAAYGAGKYVIVGGTGALYYSSNLIDWTKVENVGTASFYSIVYDNNIFIIGASDGSIYTSVDGVTWTLRTSGVSQVNSLIYANGLFVAAAGTQVITSPDGVTWTVRSLSGGIANAVITNIFYLNSLFIAVGLQGTIYTSTDGITWSFRSGDVYGQYRSIYHVVYTGEKFIAVGGAGLYMTSTDGSTWSSFIDVSLANFQHAAVISGVTVAFGNKTCVIIDGAPRKEVLQDPTWSLSYGTPSSINVRTVAHNGIDTYVAAAGYTGSILKSSDGVTWTACLAPDANDLTTQNNRSIAHFVNGKWFVMGGSHFLYSDDATTWTINITPAVSYTFNAVAYGAGTYAVVGSSGACYTSSDGGATWTQRSVGSATIWDIIFANDTFVAVGASGACWSSTDGITWTQRSAGSSELNRVIYANGLFVAVGVGGVIYTSTDGITWTSRTSNVSAVLWDVIWNGSMFCAVGASSSITTSTDGITWVKRTPVDTSATFNAIAWGASRFVATSSDGKTWTSTDGISWNRISTAFYAATYGTAFLGGKFICSGPGFIQTSTDGLDWVNCDHVRYVPNSINNIQKIGDNYYALTNAGLFRSTDGIEFLALKSLPMRECKGIATNGTSLLATFTGSAGGTIAFYKSNDDGATWSKSSELGTSTNTATIATTVNDLVYASGYYICSLATVAAHNISAMMRSTDGVVWTMIYLSGMPTGNILASDGTTVVFTQSGSGMTVLKSNDGGETWSYIASIMGVSPMHTNGKWLLGSYVTKDFVTIKNAPTTVAAYAFDDYVIGLSNLAKITYSLKGYIVTEPFKGKSSQAQIKASYKPIITRGNVAMTVPGSFSNNIYPHHVIEIPMFSYDTSTTFWVPPTSNSAGQTSYICAGA